MFNLRLTKKESVLLFSVVMFLAIFLSVGIIYLGKGETQPVDSPTVSIAKSVGVVNFTGYETITPNSTTASSLTIPSVNHTKAFITLETADVRYLIHGPAPTITEGHRLYSSAYQNVTLNTRSQLEKFKVISVLTHGTIKVSYGE